MKTSFISLILIFCLINFFQCSIKSKNNLNEWLKKVSSPIFNCNYTESIDEKTISDIPLVEVVKCSEPGAIYQYDYKVKKSESLQNEGCQN